MSFWDFKTKNINFFKLHFLSNQKECKKSSKLISTFFNKKNMFCLKQVHVHWVNLMNKQIISTFQRFEILNKVVVMVNIAYTNLLVVYIH
jgi:hypothetical protein